MTRDETIALWRQGREAWNAWANEMLAERKRLEEAGLWHAERREEAHNELVAMNSATQDWLNQANVCFSDYEFSRGRITGANTGFPLEETALSFEGFLFPSLLDFSNSQIHLNLSFEKATFLGDAVFKNTVFYGHTDFSNAIFMQYARFWQAEFHKIAWFEGALFSWRARFPGVKFLSSTSFRQAKFTDVVSGEGASFGGIKVEERFNLTKAQFSKVPAFNQANFVEGPDLDDVTYPHPPFWRLRVKRFVRNPNFGNPAYPDANTYKETAHYQALRADAAKYRHLRRLANLGHDHENEAKAFKGETRAKRGTEHMPWHAAYWVGVFYDALSDFGRSMMRPFYAWAVLTLFFAAFYLFTSAVHPPPVGQEAGFFERNLPFTRAAIRGELQCQGNDLSDISPLGEAGYLAIKNGLIVIGLGSEGKINQAHACLYGGSVGAPVFPSGISIWQIVQNFLSAPLIFLFLLGIRNNFKIK